MDKYKIVCPFCEGVVVFYVTPGESLALAAAKCPDDKTDLRPLLLGAIRRGDAAGV